MTKMSTISKTFICTLFLSSCSITSIAVAKQFDIKNGTTVSNDSRQLNDTPAHWEEFRRMMDMHIDREKSGVPAYHGYKTTWNEFWRSAIDVLTPERQENWSKYVKYIVESRRKAGLPELNEER